MQGKSVIRPLYLFFRLKGLTKSYFGVISVQKSHKVLFLLEKKVSKLRNVVPTSKVQLPKSITSDTSFCYFRVSLSIESSSVSTLAGHCTFYVSTGQRGLIYRHNTV